MKLSGIFLQADFELDLCVYAYLDHMDAMEARGDVCMEKDPGWVRQEVSSEDDFWAAVNRLREEGYSLIGGPYVDLDPPAPTIGGEGGAP